MTKKDNKKNLKLTVEEVKALASKSRLALTAEEEKNISDSSEGILSMIEEILKVDMEEGKVVRDFKNVNNMREDKIEKRTSKNRDSVLAQMPKTQDDYLKTKKILNN